jgi:CheY-like chemotaxis protein
VNRPHHSIKILLAEDDEDDFVLFQEALKGYPLPVFLDWVKDGDALMNALKQDKTVIPDLVFLDINMPRKNGFECLTEIRQTENLKHLPVIIYSTSNDRALISWMYNAGANLYLSKPSNFGQLKQSIQKAISFDWKKRTPFPPVEDFILI